MAEREEGDSPGRTGFAVAGVAAIIIALIGMFGAHAASVLAVPQVLQADIARALSAADLGAVDIEMDGQDARLLGVVPTQADVARAQRAAYSAAGGGGPWAGGVTNVDVSRLVVGPSQSPFRFRATRRGDVVTLEGYAPSGRARQEIVRRAQDAFPPGTNVLNRMQIAGGAPSPYWRRVAGAAVQQLARLRSGQVRLSDGQLLLIGEGQRADVDAINEYYAASLPQPFTARTDLTIAGEALAIPELAGVDLSNANAATCETAFAQIMARNVITFDTGSAAINPASRPLLDNLARVALRCDTYAIEVSGHTDNVGAREANLELSRQRAAAVVSYLAGRNVAAERLSAVGFGPDRPVAPNTTPQGQAANRRIVFSVRG